MPPINLLIGTEKKNLGSEPSPWQRLSNTTGIRLRSLCGRDGDPFLLAGIGDVRDCRALHVAFPAQVVELGAPVHGAAIVPNSQVVDAPTMRVDELPLRGIGDELVNQGASVRLRHAEDAPSMGGKVERFATGFRDGTH